VDWRTLRWLLGVIVCTGIGIGIYLLDDYQFVNHPSELMSIFLWTTINLVIVAIAALGCINPAYHRADERFPLQIGVVAKFEGATFVGTTRDISLNGCSIGFESPLVFGAAPLELHLAEIGGLSGRVVRRKGGREIAIQFLGVPKSTRTALFVRIFLNPDNHNHPLEETGKIYTECFKRMFRVIE
jgi:PilZ domain